MFRKTLILLILALSCRLYSQTDREFWFAAPDVSSNHGDSPWNGAPIYLHITAQYATHVKVSRPADTGFTAIENDLDALERWTIRLDGTLLPIDEIETYPTAALTGQDKGFLIEAGPGEVTAYYELDQYWNRDIFALKGANALGKEFIVTTQTYWDNGTYSNTAFSGFVIVATENNTSITVYPNDDFLYFPLSGPITLILNKGETYAFRATDRFVANHPRAVRVTSTKNIAITLYDDSMASPEGCRDIFGDQTIPVGLIGHEYVILKGDLNAATGERIFVTASQIPTDIYIDDILSYTINSLTDVFSYQITNLYTHVYASQPVWINHITGFGCEMGGAVLPTIDNCTGSNDVVFTRTPNGSDSFFLNIMVRNDTNSGSPIKNKAIKNFTLRTNSSYDTVPETYFTYIRDSTFAVLKSNATVDGYFSSKIAPGEEALVSNHIARFHLGVINGGAGTGCKYGYFSDYAASHASAGLGGATATTAEVYCSLDPIHLVATGGVTYDWDAVGDPSLTLHLSDSTIGDPYLYPDTTRDYVFNVHISQECFTDTTITLLARVVIGPVSDFDISESMVCSPFSPFITNKTNPIHAKSMNWIFRSPYDTTIVNDTIFSNPFLYSLPINTSDSAQHYEIELLSKGPYGSCPNSRTKGLVVYPIVTAGFTVDDTIDCHPLSVTITNTSTGHLDSTSYNWDFGDFTHSFEENPGKTYTNFSLNDTVYLLRLITESPYGCLDTAKQNITVHPRVSAKFAADTSSMCTPLNVQMNPGNSFGADTLWWNIDYFYGDSTYKTTSKAPLNIVHSDTSLLAGPDTLWVQLVVGNRMGCMDTAVSKRLIAYPEVIADFTISDNDICDSVPITLTNESVGYEIFYEWDFGNNTFRQDTLIQSHNKLYYNRTDADTNYTITLSALSGYFCESSKDTTITVHPYIKADFGLNYETNCSPADAIIYNTSIRAHNSFWDLGSGVFLDPSPILNTTFINPHSNKDTLYYIKLVTTNTEGCSDSLTRSIYLYPRVIADFNLVKNSNCPPLDVQFTNTSTGGYFLTYTWEFGDNTSSSDSTKIFTKQYNNETPNDLYYPIKLTARNQVGCDSSWYDTIAVFANIRADFSLDDYENCPPFSIQASEDCSQGTNVFNWTFGDGNTSTLENPSNTYFNNTTQNDTLTVRLIAIGANDADHQLCADTATRKVVVFPKLSASFNFSGDSVACQPLITGINNTSNILTGSEFRWFIDDEFYERNETPQPITFSNTTAFDITKTVYLYGRTINGCLDTTSHTLTAYSLVDAYFTVNRDTLCSGDSVSIDRRNSQGGITDYRWSFEGEIPASFAVPEFYHSFENLAGGVTIDKNILLIAQNSHNCLDSMQRRVTIAPQVYAGFNFDNNSVCYPHNTQITNSTQYAESYYWDLGDNINSTELNPSHPYINFSKTDDKTFTVKLIAKSRYNCYDSINQPITIKAKPAADFYFPVQAKCPPFEAEMINNSIGSNLAYLWDFASEGTSTETSPTHTFSNDGNDISVRPITLIVTSDKDCSDTLAKSVNVYPNVNVDFEMSEDAGCSPLNIQFTGDTNLSVAQMYWYIDGRAFSTIKDPSYRFANETPGNKVHNIRFVALSLFECADTMDRQVTVYPTPSAEFIPSPLPADYGTTDDQTPITFNNETVYQSNWSYEWDYGDGNKNNEPANSFTYNYGALFWGKKADNYLVPVRLLAWNSANPECRDSVNRDIIIYPPLPQVNVFEDLAACVPYEVDLSSFTKYVYEDSLLWDFGDGIVSTEADPIHEYTKAGVYTVKLIVKGDGGTNWDYKIITVNPKPEVDFTFNDSIVFDSSQTKGYDWINFYNHTRYANNYYWYFDSDNNLGGTPDSEEKEPYWHYEEKGTYYVALIAESGDGCLDTMIHQTPIRVLGEGFIKFPTAFFVSPDGARDEYDTQTETNKMVFYPLNQGVDEYRLEIYNRWGVMVFESDDVNKGWNGFIQGTPAKQDVYVWRVKGRFTNGQPFDMSGDVTVIRGRDEVNPSNL